MKTWLLLDANYLCCRAFFALGQLTHADVGTGVVYGFLRDIVSLQDIHATDNVAFCFDRGESKRKEIYPAYKSNRREISEEQKLLFGELRRQVKLLRTEYLTSLGYKNVFSKKGYEADDIIASLCRTLPKRDEAIIVSADHDLYQLINHRIIQFHPQQKQAVTLQSFKEKFGITPDQWPDVKAMAGCASDAIKGIAGVGEITAARYMAGTLGDKSKKAADITNGRKIWKRNLKLVRLPFPGTPTFTLREDKVDEGAWRKLSLKLGMKSMQDKAPISSRTPRRSTRKGFFD